MNRCFIKKTISAVLLFMMAVSFSGCSEFLQEIAIEKVTDYTTEVINDFINDPVSTISDNSIEEVSLTDLSDEQLNFAIDSISDISFKIKKVKINEKRTNATVTVVFEDVADLFEDNNVIGTIDEISDSIKSKGTTDYTLNFQIERQEDGWKFVDMSALDEVFFAPYNNICVLDENGFPLNITSGYVATIFVDSYWYDPISANPTNATTFNNALYLQHVFYFTHPMTMDFTCELRLDGVAVDSYTVSLQDSVIATCDFENEDGSSFNSGSYTIALLYNDQVVLESSSVTVR